MVGTLKYSKSDGRLTSSRSISPSRSISVYDKSNSIQHQHPIKPKLNRSMTPDESPHVSFSLPAQPEGLCSTSTVSFVPTSNTSTESDVTTQPKRPENLEHRLDLEPSELHHARTQTQIQIQAQNIQAVVSVAPASSDRVQTTSTVTTPSETIVVTTSTSTTTTTTTTITTTTTQTPLQGSKSNETTNTSGSTILTPERHGSKRHRHKKHNHDSKTHSEDSLMMHTNGSDRTSTDKPHKPHHSSKRSSLGPRRSSKHSSLGHVSRHDNNNYNIRATQSENVILKSHHHHNSETDSLKSHKPSKSKSSKLKKRSKGKGKDRESEEDIILLSSDSKRKLLSLNGDTNKSWLGEAVRIHSQYDVLVLICHRLVLLLLLLYSSRKRTTGRFTKAQVA